jgi:hypothetical protein
LDQRSKLKNLRVSPVNKSGTRQQAQLITKMVAALKKASIPEDKEMDGKEPDAENDAGHSNRNHKALKKLKRGY